MSNNLTVTPSNINNFQPVTAATSPDDDITEVTLKVLTSLTRSDLSVNNPQSVTAATSPDDDITEVTLKVLPSLRSDPIKIIAIEVCKFILAPISLALILLNAVLWLAVKPLWIALLAPGFIGDAIVMGPIALNKAIGHVTYGPLKDISDWMYEKHWKYMENVGAFMESFD